MWKQRLVRAVIQTHTKNDSMKQLPLFDLAVIGGGIAGLTASLYAARAGRSVIVFERAPQAGGRASTQVKEGFHFNQGPHALYRAGEGVEVLRELGISYSGAPASPEGSWVLLGEEKHPIPRTAAALETTRLFSDESRREAARIFAELGEAQSAEWDHSPLQEWLDARITHGEVRALFEGLFRLSTYCDDSTLQSAGAVLAQMRAGKDGVDYLDGGWQSLVENL
ncbi:MAG: NAD(P)/FAD-dependent oxidoreductase, partial [Verrucomicrobiaceae bacterium]